MRSLDYLKEARTQGRQYYDNERYMWYCKPNDGTSFYTDGMFKLNKSGIRDTHFRKVLLDKTGIHIAKPNQLGGRLLYPDTKEEVCFSWLRPDVWLIYDEEHNMVFKSEGWRTGLLYQTTEAVPTCSTTIKTYKPNPRLRKGNMYVAKEAIEQFCAMYELAKGVSDIYDQHYVTSPQHYDTQRTAAIVKLLTNPSGYNEYVDAVYIKTIASGREAWLKHVARDACDVREVSHLIRR